ncbi:hypothetical protein [Apilactobacillus timberlakei]|uniref:hypothetical protein n=1 Tax=Apilactobacillus timberlakei TaxID=2008380 RepID=UPI001127B30E|nr:hypothetical protein [Apilactobacillus timberlakei]TPR15885.1 hypothetical protein DYZ95_08025 [Apilactobacillus timberlakei]
MNKTIKQMADFMGINKLRIYRFIDKSDIESSKVINGAKTYDKSAQKLIYKHFGYIDNYYNKDNDNKSDNIKGKDELIKFIKDEIEEKNKQIDNLQKILDQQQQLSLQDKNTISEQKQKLKSMQLMIDTTYDNKNDNSKNHWWKFWI